MELVHNNVCQHQLDEAHKRNEEVILRDCTAVDRELNLYSNTKIYQGGYKAISVCTKPTQPACTTLDIYGGHYDILHVHAFSILKTYAYEDTITTTDGTTSHEVKRHEPVEANTIMVHHFAELNDVKAHEVYIHYGRVEVKHDCEIEELHIKFGSATITEKGVKKVLLWNDGDRVLISEEAKGTVEVVHPAACTTETSVVDGGYTLIKLVAA